tara:strand:- start:790 stop:1317 length:528 start_codon:yes stop_codon:yes gene_type:complete
LQIAERVGTIGVGKGNSPPKTGESPSGGSLEGIYYRLLDGAVWHRPPTDKEYGMITQTPKMFGYFDSVGGSLNTIDGHDENADAIVYRKRGDKLWEFSVTVPSATLFGDNKTYKVSEETVGDIGYLELSKLIIYVETMQKNLRIWKIQKKSEDNAAMVDDVEALEPILKVLTRYF